MWQLVPTPVIKHWPLITDKTVPKWCELRDENDHRVVEKNYGIALLPRRNWNQPKIRNISSKCDISPSPRWRKSRFKKLPKYRGNIAPHHTVTWKNIHRLQTSCHFVTIIRRHLLSRQMKVTSPPPACLNKWPPDRQAGPANSCVPLPLSTNAGCC